MNTAKKRRRLALLAAAVTGIALAAWLNVDRPWEREVWVTTTMDAFVGPAPGKSAIRVDEGKIWLAVGLTPAPWPEQAQAIHAAVRRGKRVHVTVRTDKTALRFDTDRVTPDGELLVACATAQEARRLAAALGLD